MLRFLLFVGSVMMAGTSIAEGASTCPVDSIPIQFVDEHGTRSVKPQYGSLAWDVADHIATRLGRENLCIDSAESKKRSLLQFVHWFLYSREDAPLPPGLPLDAFRALELPLDVHPSNGCKITSPWIDIAIERKPVPWVRAIVRSNERQLLADQAVLAGAKNVPPGVAKPLTIIKYSHFASEYNEYEYSKRSGEPMAKPPIEELIPPDILWLLSRSDSGEFHMESLDIAMNNAKEKSAEGYTKLVLALIDRCFVSSGADLNYDSILDAADLISLNQYKITTPINDLIR